VSTERAEIAVPADSLVVLIGPAGSGKSTFARRHFPPSTVLSSDGFRDVLRGDPSDQSATVAAFRLLHVAAEERLRRGALTVVDATNVEFDAREPLVELANRFERASLAIVFGLSLAECLEWNARRPAPTVPVRVIRRQHALFVRAIPHLELEGFTVVRLAGPAAVAAASVMLLPSERSEVAGA
jgi:predicted kinase